MLARGLHLARMLRNERLPLARLLAVQDERLRALVREAGARVPFYRELYRGQGVDVSRFRGLEDLASLPIVDKRALRAAGEAARMPQHRGRRLPISTSGSTGEPFSFVIDEAQDQWRKAQYLRPYLSAGRALTDSVLRLTAFPRRRRLWVQRLGLLREEALDCRTAPHVVVARWQALAPRVLQGYPSALRALASYLLERGERLSPAPKRVFTDSELLTADTRALLERAFGTRIIDVFGTFETDNIAYQCEHASGYHVALDSVVLEVLRDGRRVAPGEEGELVVTVLGGRLSPFIRYNLRDVGRLAGAPCACGRTFPLLEVIRGRADDYVDTGDGRSRSAMDLLACLDGFAHTLRHYQLRQRELRRFELALVPSGRLTCATREEIAQALGALLPDARLEVQVVDEIAPAPSGKLRAFVSDLRAHG